MNIIEALKTAISYEEKVRDTYKSAAEKTPDPAGVRVFTLMAKEENDHVSYLSDKLKDAVEGTPLSAEDLTTELPDPETIAAATESLNEKLEDIDRDGELAMLAQAREVELETSRFYKKMVKELPDEGKAFFQRFVEIENGHVLLVEAEIDYLQHKGAWIAIDHGELKTF